jgi:membrane protease YdiL (CAAX protease family)
LQAGDEEVFFRGYLLPRVTAWVKRPWVAAVLTTLVFAGLHVHVSWPAKAAIVCLGLAFCAATIRTGTLAPAIGMHVMNNSLLALWFPNETNAQVRWTDFWIAAGELLCWMGWLWWVTRGEKKGSTSSTPIAERLP